MGYKNESVGSFKITSSTFTLTSGSEKLTLGDIKPNANFTELTDLIQTFTSAGKAGTAYVYLTKESAEEFELTPGWYDNLDSDCETPMNDVEIPYTQGYVVKSQDGSGAELTFAGSVKTTETEIPVGGFTITANVTPVNLTLGDIKPNANFTELTDLIQTFTPAGKAGTAYVYLTKESAEEFELTPGWYDNLDSDCETPLNDVAIPSGSGFVVKSADGAGATLTLPSPLK